MNITGEDLEKLLNDDVETAEYLLKQSSLLLHDSCNVSIEGRDAKDTQLPLLFLLIMFGAEHVIAYLLENSAQLPLNIENHTKLNPFEVAILFSQPKICALLKIHHVNINSIQLFDAIDRFINEVRRKPSWRLPSLRTQVLEMFPNLAELLKTKSPDLFIPSQYSTLLELHLFKLAFYIESVKLEQSAPTETPMLYRLWNYVMENKNNVHIERLDAAAQVLKVLNGEEPPEHLTHFADIIKNDMRLEFLVIESFSDCLPGANYEAILSANIESDFKLQ